MDNVEKAEVYLKEILSIPIELAIKDLNNALNQDSQIPGLKIIVTGGQAIQTYFPKSQPLRTHDFDLKLIAPKNVQITSSVRNRMILLGKGCAKYLEISLNNYDISQNIKDTIYEKYNIELITEGKLFSSVSHLKNDLLNIVTFKMRYNNRIRTNSIADIYVVDPDEIKEHYYTFTGLEGSNAILSEDAGNYYIPFKYINGIPYAGMGYVLWDTLRMIEVSKNLGLPKHEKYIQKKDAIIQALNNPNDKISCDSMESFISKCNKSINDCQIKGRKYKTVNSLLRFAVDEGLIPNDNMILNKIRNTYDLNNVCESIKRVL